MGNCCGHHGNSPVTRRRDPDSPTKLAKATYCACRPRTASCVLGCIMASLCALVWSMRPLYWCRAVTIDEVNALKELYKHVSNSLHKVRTAAACPSCQLFRSQRRGSALCREMDSLCVAPGAGWRHSKRRVHAGAVSHAAWTAQFVC